MKEHRNRRNRFSVFPLLCIYISLSGKTDHIADVQVRKTQIKSIPVPCWEIHYSKINSLHSVSPCAWFALQTGHTVCRGICWDLSPKCGLSTTSARFLRHFQPALLHILSLELHPSWPRRHSLNIFLQLSVVAKT